LQKYDIIEFVSDRQGSSVISRFVEKSFIKFAIIGGMRILRDVASSIRTDRRHPLRML
uniref:Nitro_FeMo-Co domain-containing protein n=1 Tax=Rodentolepis nana TaxID=102285 RepID=A0A0R3TZH5_RODNA